MNVSSVDPNIFAKFGTLVLVKVRGIRWLEKIWPNPPDILTVRNKVIKVVSEAHLGEAQTLRYLAEHTSIPVPKVYWAFIYGGQTYTVMSKVKGKMLWENWNERSASSKDKIFRQLKSILTELRGIPLPPNTGVASITGGPIFDSLLLGESIYGPFKTAAGFYQVLMNGTDLQYHWPPHFDQLNVLSEFYKQAQYDLVFTHGDLSMFNIMASDDEITGIIDWETSGWYPSFWEYTKAKDVNPHTKFWATEIDHFMEPWPHELAMDRIRLRFFDWYGMNESAIPSSLITDQNTTHI